MKTFQHFSPYNALQWEPNDSRSKRHFQYKLQTVQREGKKICSFWWTGESQTCVTEQSKASIWAYIN